MSTFKETPFNIDGERRFPDAVHFYFNGKDFFNDLSYLRRKLCKKRYLLEYEKGEKLISQGERVEYCFFMESGGVISYETVNGKRRIYDFFTGANLLLCSYALYDRPCALDYEARCHTVVYSISLERVQKLFFNDSAFTRGALAQTTRDLLVCQDLLRKSAMRNVSWLVSDFLIVMASRGCYEEDGVLYISERFTQHQMADMLFINRITCLNELHRMEDRGLITLQRSHIGGRRGQYRRIGQICRVRTRQQGVRILHNSRPQRIGQTMASRVRHSHPQARKAEKHDQQHSFHGPSVFFHSFILSKRLMIRSSSSSVAKGMVMRPLPAGEQVI